MAPPRGAAQLRVAVALLAAAMSIAAPARAEVYSLGVTSALVTLDQDRLFEGSAFGRRVFDTLDAASAELSAENRGIEAALSEEERALTEARVTLPPDEFRVLAEAFDTRVTALRTRQQNRARALGLWRDMEQQRFFEAALPVLAQLMRETGATAILDTRAILLSSEEADITDRAITRIDALLGDAAASAPAVFGPATLPAEPADLVVPRPPADDTDGPRPAPGNGLGVIEGPPVALPDPDAPVAPLAD